MSPERPSASGTLFLPSVVRSGETTSCQIMEKRRNYWVMTTTTIPAPSKTRETLRWRGRRIGLFMVAVMAPAYLNFTGESRFWTVDQRSSRAAVHDYSGLIEADDPHRGGDLRPLYISTNTVKNALDRQRENVLGGKETTKIHPPLADSWPIKRMREAVCNQKELDALRVPSFIIAGSQKAGTSALYTLLRMHPHVVSSRKFEVHFFDHRLSEYRGRDPASVSVEEICERRRAYQKYFDIQMLPNLTQGTTTKIASFEKTPRYICYSYIPGFVKRITPWTKILMILRNPVDRAYSQWKMDASRMRGDPSFPSFETSMSLTVDRLKELGMSNAPSLEQFRNKAYKEEDFQLPINQTLLERHRYAGDGNNDTLEKLHVLTKDIPRGFYAQQIMFWLDYFEYGKDMKIIQYEELQKDRPGVFRDILKFVDVDPDAWAMADEVFKLDFRPVSVFGKQANQNMDGTTRKYLEKFYKPYNDELASLLGEDFRGIWNS